jgi:hypothetical protein
MTETMNKYKKEKKNNYEFNFKDLKLCKICKKEFKNLNGLSIHLKLYHNIKIKEYIIEYELNGNIPKCKCGCGGETLWFQNHFCEYLSGHFSKTNLFKNPLSKKGKIPKNKLILSETDKEYILNEFVNNHKTIRQISKKFKCSINPIKSFLKDNFPIKEYYELVNSNQSWRCKNIPELNTKLKIATSKGG